MHVLLLMQTTYYGEFMPCHHDIPNKISETIVICGSANHYEQRCLTGPFLQTIWVCDLKTNARFHKHWESDNPRPGGQSAGTANRRWRANFPNQTAVDSFSAELSKDSTFISEDVRHTVKFTVRSLSFHRPGIFATLAIKNISSNSIYRERFVAVFCW